ncbi:MAG: hypothetical protein WCR33_04820 [Bacilli bacterium]
MSLSNAMVYVIKKEDGLYVNAKFGALFTGRTSGFSGYGDKEEMKKDLEKLGDGYYGEYINLNEIPIGERVYL